MATTKYTTKKADAIFAKLAEGRSITAAMASAGLSRYQYYNWRETIPGFAEAADQAIEAGTDRLEDIAATRAEEQSDTLIIFLLKARRRDKYGDKWSGELSGKDGAPLIVQFGTDDKGPQ